MDQPQVVADPIEIAPVVKTWCVAFYMPHNDGCEKGIIDGPGFDSGSLLVDMYEVDGAIKSFESREDAEAWLEAQKPEEYDDDEEEDDEEDDEDDCRGEDEED